MTNDPLPSFILTADPDFAAMAQAELYRVQPEATVLAELAPGVWPVSLRGGFMALAEQWRHSPPIFVRHICPVQITVPLTGTTEDLPLLQQAVQKELLDLMTPDLPFSVQTRLWANFPYKPFDVNSVLANTIQSTTGAPLNIRHPEQILSMVIAGKAAYGGVSLAVHNLSDWAGGVRRLARDKEQISRAEFKLLEALEVFQIELPPFGTALDLGAAPGGWTRVLRQHNQYVTAVDPADLHPSLKNDPKIRYKPMTAEAYLANDPDQFDIIVNDMRQDARDSAKLMAAYASATDAPCLYAHGIALMTFKLPAKGRAQVLDHAFNILSRAYHIAGARHLFHNRSEITVYLKPRTQPTSSSRAR